MGGAAGSRRDIFRDDRYPGDAYTPAAEVDEAIRVMEAEAPGARRRLEGAEGIERGARVLHHERYENLPGGEAQVWMNTREAERLAAPEAGA